MCRVDLAPSPGQLPRFAVFMSIAPIICMRAIAKFWARSKCQFSIPTPKPSILRIIGIDPIIGLIPGIGDLGSYGVSLALIYTMYQHGASGMLIARMLINASLDAIFGSIPILGSLFDFWFKANDRNVKLLREHYEEGKHSGSGRGLIALVLIVVFLIAAALLFLALRLHRTCARVKK